MRKVGQIRRNGSLCKRMTQENAKCSSRYRKLLASRLESEMVGLDVSAHLVMLFFDFVHCSNDFLPKANFLTLVVLELSVPVRFIGVVLHGGCLPALG